MTRKTRTIRSCLRVVALGTIAATAVAWACALWMPTRFIRPPVLDQWTGTLLINGPGYSGTTLLFARGFEDGPMEWAYRGESTFEAGWPLKMYRSEVVPRSSLSGFDLPIRDLLRRGYPTDRLPAWVKAQPNRRLPVVPMWGGLVGNVVIWGGLVFGVACLWRWGYRWRVGL